MLTIKKEDSEKADYFKAHNTVSAGWSCGKVWEERLKQEYEQDKKDIIKKDVREFLDLAREDYNQYPGKKWDEKKLQWYSQQSFQKLIGEEGTNTQYLKNNDYVWFFNHEKYKYYLGKVIDDTFKLVINPDTVKIDVGTQLEKVEFIEAGSPNEILPFITSKSAGGHQRTFMTIDDNEGEDIAARYSKYVWEQRENAFTLKNPNEFLSSVGYDGLEDLIFAYLSDKKGYTIIPSTNKISTFKFEFIMKDEDNHKYTLQAKNGGHISLDVKDYENNLNDFEGIYLFTRNGEIIDMDGKHHEGLGLCKLYKKKGKIELDEVINQEDLVDYATNGDNYWRLPDSFEKLNQIYKK